MFTNTVQPELMKALEVLMLDPHLNAFYLVGGTSLALRFGHRRSVDIDLFTHEDFNASRLAEQLRDSHGLRDSSVEENTVRGCLVNVKLDVIAHKYPLLAPIDEQQGIRMASLADVAAMKLNAIANRGSKKDFWDYAALLDHFSIQQMLSFFEEKYRTANVWHVEKSLLYFDDAENDPDPVDFTGQSWDAVKKRIRKSCLN
ncbi:MAG: nucleotidyl transferase AbiEii/AbiGii toxin family protein [Kiritimatiellae bacterium]|nr:nucleotidyl transferase AbiEii/AbiGii toxin family protein [Kiritimatiellia bacterium]